MSLAAAMGESPAVQPQRALAAAVVLMAWEDAVRPHAWGPSDAGTVTAAERSQAEHFLFDRGGAWASARGFWCSLAGINPDVLRARALARRDRGGAAAAPTRPGAMVASGTRAQDRPGTGLDVSSLKLAGSGQPGPAAFSGGSVRA